MRFIKKTSEYRETYQSHRKVTGSFFTVLYRFRSGEEEAAIGIVIRAKVGKAVIRNKLKRRIRAYLQQRSEHFDRSMSAIIIARDNAAEAGWAEITRDLDRSFASIETRSGAEG